MNLNISCSFSCSRSQNSRDLLEGSSCPFSGFRRHCSRPRLLEGHLGRKWVGGTLNSGFHPQPACCFLLSKEIRGLLHALQLGFIAAFRGKDRAKCAVPSYPTLKPHMLFLNICYHSPGLHLFLGELWRTFPVCGHSHVESAVPRDSRRLFQRAASKSDLSKLKVTC